MNMNRSALLCMMGAGLFAASSPSFVVKKGRYKGFRVRASSVYNKDRTPDRAFDGSLSTNWIPKRLPCWIEIDLGKVVTVGAIVWNADRGTGYRTRVPHTYRFTGSLTGEFRNEHFVLAGAEGNRKSSKVKLVFKPRKVRYVRMEIYTTWSDKTKDLRHFQPNVDEIRILPPPYEKTEDAK